jgi:hypothetical protein
MAESPLVGGRGNVGRHESGAQSVSSATSASRALYLSLSETVT